MRFHDKNFVSYENEATIANYSEIDAELKCLKSEKPSVERFVKAAELLARGFEIAEIPPKDIEVTRRPWVANALELMSSIGERIDRTKVKFGDLHVPDEERERMVKAFMKSFCFIDSWALTVIEQYGNATGANHPQSVSFADYFLSQIWDSVYNQCFALDPQFVAKPEKLAENLLFGWKAKNTGEVEYHFEPKAIVQLLNRCEYFQINKGIEEANEAADDDQMFESYTTTEKAEETKLKVEQSKIVKKQAAVHRSEKKNSSNAYVRVSPEGDWIQVGNKPCCHANREVEWKVLDQFFDAVQDMCRPRVREGAPAVSPKQIKISPEEYSAMSDKVKNFVNTWMVREKVPNANRSKGEKTYTGLAYLKTAELKKEKRD